MSNVEYRMSNIECRISNVELPHAHFDIRHSIFDIRHFLVTALRLLLPRAGLQLNSRIALLVQLDQVLDLVAILLRHLVHAGVFARLTAFLNLDLTDLGPAVVDSSGHGYDQSAFLMARRQTVGGAE